MTVTDTPKCVRENNHFRFILKIGLGMGLAFGTGIKIQISLEIKHFESNTQYDRQNTQKVF